MTPTARRDGRRPRQPREARAGRRPASAAAAGASCSRVRRPDSLVVRRTPRPSCWTATWSPAAGDTSRCQIRSAPLRRADARMSRPAQPQLRDLRLGDPQPVPVAVLFIALVLVGLISYGQLPIKQFPNVEFPVVTVTVTQNGAAPARDGDPDHPARRGRAWPASPTSRPSPRPSPRASRPPSIAVRDGRPTCRRRPTTSARKIDQTRAILPRDIDPPTVQRLEIDDQPILTYAVAAPGHVRRRPVLVRRRHRRPRPAGRAGASPRSPASAASTARSTSLVDPERLAAAA